MAASNIAQIPEPLYHGILAQYQLF